MLITAGALAAVVAVITAVAVAGAFSTGGASLAFIAFIMVLAIMDAVSIAERCLAELAHSDLECRQRRVFPQAVGRKRVDPVLVVGLCLRHFFAPAPALALYQIFFRLFDGLGDRL